MRKIIKIDKDFIIYQELNEEKNINLKECNNNWISYKNRNGEKFCECDFKYIGQRNSGSDPKYIEIFNKPFIRFEFYDYEEYRYVRDEILGNGWLLIDLS